MSETPDKLTARIAADIDATRQAPVKLAADLYLGAAAFRPAKMFKHRTDYSPNAYLAPARPGIVYAALNDSGLTTMPPGLIEAINPAVAERIGTIADGIRRVGVPVVVVLVDRTPSEKN